MKDLYKSSFVFDIIDEFEVFSYSGSINSFSDEAFLSFCDKYKLLSSQRDEALFNYLNSTPGLFRCHLPHSKWSLGIAFNVVWYYDELILIDPVLQLINSEISNPEEKKHQLQNILNFLKECKESIDDGYLLFSGDNLIPGKTGQFDNYSKQVIEIPQVLDAYEAISAMGKKASPINENVSDNLTHLEIFYDGLWGEIRKMGMYVPQHVLGSGKMGNGVFYDFESPYERLTKEELISFNKTDMLNSLKQEYSKDISVVLETITSAQRLNSPVLFYREADCIAAKNYASMNGEASPVSFAETTIYDCLVPYIGGIAPERLADVRNQLPEAFRDFRAFIFDLVQKTMKGTDNPHEFKYKVDNEINSKIRQLTIEMKNAKRKMNFHAIAAPVALFTASMGLFSSGIDYSKLLSTLIGSGGLIKSLTTWSDVISDKNKASLNPVYFLWKAQQS